MYEAKPSPSRWEELFRQWAQAPGKTEQQRCENAEQAVRNAIKSSEKLKSRDISVFTQGSYRNRVNVRKDSDVDLGVLCRDTFFFELPEGYQAGDFDISTPAAYQYAQFKNEVGEALVAYFGRDAVNRGNKAFDVRENSYHVEADVAPFFEHRVYRSDRTYLSGVKLLTDKGETVINWPEQHYANAVAKNDRTNRTYKGVVRILKSLCVLGSEQNLIWAAGVPGFLIECLTYNAPDYCFSATTWTACVARVLDHIERNTVTDGSCSTWTEVSELKSLFGTHQKWTREDAQHFAVGAAAFVGLK